MRLLRWEPASSPPFFFFSFTMTPVAHRYKSNEEYVYVRGRGRGKYVCEECGIRCKKPSMLKKHIRTHTDVRPYVCKHCHFAFKTKGKRQSAGALPRPTVGSSPLGALAQSSEARTRSAWGLGPSLSPHCPHSPAASCAARSRRGVTPPPHPPDPAPPAAAPACPLGSHTAPPPACFPGRQVALLHTVPGFDFLSSPLFCCMCPSPSIHRPGELQHPHLSPPLLRSELHSTPSHVEHSHGHFSWQSSPLPPPASPLRPCSRPPTQPLCSSQPRPAHIPPAPAGDPNLGPRPCPKAGSAQALAVT